ncbi:unnamed protein product [Protopolystoma xenopodis]|uniref:Uncharacterized protein n=1 Tax=Protopolystoma xenopodis TaxID=117903 RepID=A0A448X652_9PLAT|nr:unnamed protein product [Protopolystoma xenopodis]
MAFSEAPVVATTDNLNQLTSWHRRTIQPRNIRPTLTSQLARSFEGDLAILTACICCPVDDTGAPRRPHTQSTSISHSSASSSFYSSALQTTTSLLPGLLQRRQPYAEKSSTSVCLCALSAVRAKRELLHTKQMVSKAVWQTLNQTYTPIKSELSQLTLN